MKISYRKIQCNKHWGEPWSLYFSDDELNQYEIYCILWNAHLRRMEEKKNYVIFVQMSGFREYIGRDSCGQVQFYHDKTAAEPFTKSQAFEIMKNVIPIVSESGNDNFVGVEVL